MIEIDTISKEQGDGDENQEAAKQVQSEQVAIGPNSDPKNRKWKKPIIIALLLVVAFCIAIFAFFMANNPAKQLATLLDEGNYADAVKLVQEKEIEFNDQITTSFKAAAQKYTVKDINDLVELSSQDWQDIDNLNEIASTISMPDNGAIYVSKINSMSQYQEFLPVLQFLYQYSLKYGDQEINDLNTGLVVLNNMLEMMDGNNNQYVDYLRSYILIANEDLKALLDDPNFFTQYTAQISFAEVLTVLEQYQTIENEVNQAIASLPSI